MARLIYASITSLDGYVADADGSFEWSAPDEQVHAFVNDQQRPIGTYLYGRRLYEMMTAWETWPVEDDSPVTNDYAGIWRSADKIVYSTTLTEVRSRRTRLERSFDPDATARLVASAERDLLVGGPGLAADALRAGLVTEIQQFLCPVVVGGGTRFLPDELRLQLDLADERRFDNGVVYLRYLVRQDHAD